MRVPVEQSAVLVIDIQEKLLPHMQQQQLLIENCQKLIKGLIALDVPLILTEQYPKGLGVTVEPLISLLPEYKPLEKISFSCCGSESFNSALAELKRNYVIIAGIEAHVCVLQTVIDLIGRDYQPVVIEDCISSRKLNDKVIAVQRMSHEGAIVSTCESILFELCRQAGTAKFKSIAKILK
jgi:nicotinamidase-related amidase